MHIGIQYISHVLVVYTHTAQSIPSFGWNWKIWIGNIIYQICRFVLLLRIWDLPYFLKMAFSITGPRCWWCHRWSWVVMVVTVLPGRQRFGSSYGVVVRHTGWVEADLPWWGRVGQQTVYLNLGRKTWCQTCSTATCSKFFVAMADDLQGHILSLFVPLINVKVLCTHP